VAKVHLYKYNLPGQHRGGGATINKTCKKLQNCKLTNQKHLQKTTRKTERKRPEIA